MTLPEVRRIPELTPSDQNPAEEDPLIRIASPTGSIPEPMMASRSSLPVTAMPVISIGPWGNGRLVALTFTEAPLPKAM